MRELPRRDPEPFVLFFRVGNHAAEVLITHHYDSGWSPTIAADDLEKLERLHLALKRGDMAEAMKEAKVFELSPLAKG